MPDGKDYLIQEIKRKLFLALCDCRRSGKELINSALDDLEKIKKKDKERKS
jgi:hypothetical protein